MHIHVCDILFQYKNYHEDKLISLMCYFLHLGHYRQLSCRLPESCYIILSCLLPVSIIYRSCYIVIRETLDLCYVKGTGYTWRPKTVNFYVLFDIFINSRCIKKSCDILMRYILLVYHQSDVIFSYISGTTVLKLLSTNQNLGCIYGVFQSHFLLICASS